MKRTLKQIAFSVVAAMMVFASVPNIASAGSDAYIGEISYVAFDWAPDGYAQCDGQTILISSNQALYSLIGTKFGGDGTSNFKLPDMRGRVSVHKGQGPLSAPLTIGTPGGAQNATLTVANLPAHTHPATATSTSTSVVAPGASATSTLNAASVAADSQTAGGNALANAAAVSSKVYSSTAAPSVAMKSGSVVTSLTGLGITTTTNTTVSVANNTGGGSSFSIMQPYLTVNCLIATTGIYPPRPQ